MPLSLAGRWCHRSVCLVLTIDVYAKSQIGQLLLHVEEGLKAGGLGIPMTSFLISLPTSYECFKAHLDVRMKVFLLPFPQT